MSKDLNDQFRQRTKETDVGSEIDFTIQVLSSGSWPFNQSFKFSLPTELERSVQSFNAFYAKVHSGRKLVWLYNMCKGEIVTNCFKNRYTLQVRMRIPIDFVHFARPHTSWTPNAHSPLMAQSIRLISLSCRLAHFKWPFSYNSMIKPRFLPNNSVKIPVSVDCGGTQRYFYMFYHAKSPFACRNRFREPFTSAANFVESKATDEYRRRELPDGGIGHRAIFKLQKVSSTWSPTK